MGKARRPGAWNTPLELVPLAQPEEGRALPKGPGWRYEPKYDGYRLLAERDQGAVRLRYRTAATTAWPEIAHALLELTGDHFVVDGELVVPDEHGQPRFELVQSRATLHGSPALHASRNRPAVYFIFDILALGRRDLRGVELLERKEQLRNLLQGGEPALRYVDQCGEDLADTLFARSREVGEGIIAKRADSLYRPDAGWIKVKHNRTADFVIVGFTAVGAPALHLGAYVSGSLRYFGRVRAGFVRGGLERVIDGLRALVVPDPTCSGAAPGEVERWVEPRVVIEIAYVEITVRGLLRHPSFVRLRPDKSPDECREPVNR